MKIRPIWTIDDPAPEQESVEIANLLKIEARIIAASEAFLDLTRSVLDDEAIDGLASLQSAAKNDLIGGCEMARTGYLKQAYSLWRSWFEQSVFLLYFLEAPLHKIAWRTKSEITQDDNPQYRLMLHQLLTFSSEKHPFALVYDARFSKLSDAFKISGMPAAKRPIQRATRLLTMLSQGVHGTYQPQIAKDAMGLCTQVKSHCIPVLSSAEEIFNIFWVLFTTDLIALPEHILQSLRDLSITQNALNAAGIDESERLEKLAPFFAIAFPSQEKKNG